jgi:hypothetical protein
MTRKSREEKKLAKILKAENHGDADFMPRNNGKGAMTMSPKANLNSSFSNSRKNTDHRARSVNKTVYSY